MITSNLIYNAIQILGFCVFLAAFFNYYKERSGIEFSKYINKGAKMYRDINGVPFIQADTFEDGYFALGFAQAEDRLWSMYFIQKIALGELSELFGEKGLTLDKFARVLNFREVCSGSFKSLNKDEIKLYESFSAGVNHYIDTTYFLPIEFLMFGINHSQIKWKPTSSCLVQKMIEYYLTYDFFQELIRTHLLENINLSLEVISKLFPYNFDNYEFRRTIIKDEEMKDLKQEKKVIVTNEIKHAYIDENGKVMRNLDELEFKKSHAYAEKSNASLDNDEIDVNIYESKNSSLESIRLFGSLDDEKENQDINNLLRKDNGIGSNSFVISGKFTDNGHPYLCNDPHLQNSMPSFWYFSNMKINNEFHFTGASPAGIPTIFIGSNSYLSWGITNGVSDTADVIRIEKSRVNADLSIELNDTNKFRLNKRTEVIYLDVKRSKSVELEFLESEFGPVINKYIINLIIAFRGRVEKNFEDDDKYYYILRSTFTDKKDLSLKSIINFSRSKDFKELRKNLSYMSISLNIVFADKENIGYQLTGKIPKRSLNDDGSFIKTIENSYEFYTESILFEELPHLINPERGYIVTANNLVVNKEYKYILQGGFIVDARAHAIEEAILSKISKNEKIGKDYIINNLLKIIKDSYCPEILKYSFQILQREKKLNSSDRTLLNNLEEFDCEMKADSLNALIFNVFENELHHIIHISKNLTEAQKESVRLTFVEAEERINHLIYKLRNYADDAALCYNEYNMSCGEFILKAFDNTLDTIKRNIGNDISIWQWQNLNVKHYIHKPFSFITGLNYLAHRTIKTDGNWRTPKISAPKFDDKKFESIISSNFKYLVNLGDYEGMSYFSLDSGQNGRIFHRHYDDMQINHEKGILINFNSKIKEDLVKLEFLRKNK